MDYDNCLSVDTETTGTRFFGPAPHKPFFIGACDGNGHLWTWEFEVNPRTRSPIYTHKQICEISKLILSFDTLVFHNAKFDVRALSTIDVFHPTMNPPPWDRIHDTLLLSHVNNSLESHGLKDLAVKYCRMLDDDENDLRHAVTEARREAKRRGLPVGDEVAWDYWLPAAMFPGDNRASLLARYGTQDPIRTMRLFKAMYPHVIAQELEAHYERERSLLPVVYEMETKGVRLIDKEVVAKEKLLEKETGTSLYALDTTASSLGVKDFNPRSSADLQTVLYHKLKLPIIKHTPSSTPDKPIASTDADTLEGLWEHCGGIVNSDESRSLPEKPASRQKSICLAFLDNLFNFKECSSTNGYLESYLNLRVKRHYDVDSNHPKRGTLDLLASKVRGKTSFGQRAAVRPFIHELHPSFNQVGTATTRFSSKEPNGTNVSKREGIRNLRCLFGPRPHCYWLDYDYSNLELRLFAYASGDRDLIDAFESGASVHLVIARVLFPRLRSMSEDDAKETPEYQRTKNGNFSLIYGAGKARADATYGLYGAYDLIRQRFPMIDRFMQTLINQARSKGYVNTLFGYRLYVDKDKSYSAVNYCIQGTAGDVLKHAMLNADELRRCNFQQPANDSVNMPDKIVTPFDLLLCVHDELVFEAPRTTSIKQLASTLSDCMTAPGKAIGIPTPVSCSLIRRNWADKRKLALPSR